jgi:hypothetical protein
MNIVRPKELSLLVKTAIPKKRNLLIVSGPGCGKTDIILQACEDLGVKIIISHPVVSDPTDYKGLPFIVKTKSGEEEAKFLPFSDLKGLIDADSPTVFFLDDMGQAPASVQAAAMQLLLARRINDHVISDHVSFIAASNRRQDKAGVQGILEPVKSRFATIVELVPNVEDWTNWAMKKNIPLELIQFIRFREHNNQSILYSFKASADMTNSPCPRTVANVGFWMNDGLPKELEPAVFAGAAGETFATEFMAFLKIFRNLPDPDGVIANPEKATIPHEPSVMFALLGAIAYRCTTENFGNIIKFGNRVPAEYAVMLVRDCVVKDSKLAATKAFTAWALSHKDLI